jgi:hypothetical protein
MNAVHLRRTDPTRNMHRFYRLDVQPDLFGGVLPMKEWGRIGAQGSLGRDSCGTGFRCMAQFVAWSLCAYSVTQPIPVRSEPPAWPSFEPDSAVVVRHEQDAAEKIGLHVEPLEAVHAARRIDAASSP